MYKILLVEDDPTITEVLERQLAKWGYEASHVTDFQHVLETFVQQAPHLVLLDISLPFYDGYHWCGEIRKISKTPVLFISSASDNMNLVMALNMGGDDFLAKPFDLNVAIAKIEALLRRTYDFGAGVNALACRGAVLDLKDASAALQQPKAGADEKRVPHFAASVRAPGPHGSQGGHHAGPVGKRQLHRRQYPHG